MKNRGRYSSMLEHEQNGKDAFCGTIYISCHKNNNFLIEDRKAVIFYNLEVCLCMV